MNVPEIDFSNLFRHADNKKVVPAGSVLFREGDPGDGLYVIVSGELDILVGEKIVDTLTSGTIVGEMALLNHAPRSATARAKTDCEIAPVDEKRFLFMVSQTPFFALQVMRVLSARLLKTDHLYARCKG